MVYDIDWNVKKLIPMGRGKFGLSIESEKIELILSITKPEYLNTPSRLKFITTLTIRLSLRMTLFSPKRPMIRPAV